MNFLETIKTVEINEAKQIDIPTFISKISKYKNLDQAFLELPPEYIEFYLNNEKKLSKKRLFESEERGDTGWAKNATKKVVKKIKYRGNILILEWHPEDKIWQSYVGYRNVTDSLNTLKKELDV